MAPNLQFLIARRRNEHARNGQGFLNRLAKRLTVSVDQVALVPPERSVRMEVDIYSLMRAGMANGRIVRYCHLILSDAIQCFRESLKRAGDSDVDVLLCRSPSFAFRCSTRVVVNSIGDLIGFDKESVTVVLAEGRAGVVLDVETEAEDPQLYEVDTWEQVEPPGC